MPPGNLGKRGFSKKYEGRNKIGGLKRDKKMWTANVNNSFKKSGCENKKGW